MKICEYPECKNTELNEWNMCKKHEVNYGIKDKRNFNIKEIQNGLKKLGGTVAEYIPNENIDMDNLTPLQAQTILL